MSSATFYARLWIGNKEDGVVEKTTWDNDLTPLNIIPAREWGSNHLDYVSLDDLRDMIQGLPEEYFEVMFKATITGRFSGYLGEEEWDEELEILEYSFQELPKEWLYGDEAQA